MFQSHTATLSLAAIASRMHSSYTKHKEEHLMASLLRCPLNEYSLNYLYHLTRQQHPDQQSGLLFRTDFLLKVSQWIIDERTVANGLERALSPRSQLQIIELMELLISYALDFPTLGEQVLLASQEILTYFYEVVERSEKEELRGKYLDCISKMFRIRPDIFNVNIYAELLSLTDQKVDEFYEFLDYYLLQRNAHDDHTLAFILEGLAKRMRMFSERSMITRLERRGILKAYAKLIAFLRGKAATPLPEKVLSEYGCLFESLLGFVSREFDQQELCRVLNGLVEVYMRSAVNNLSKFRFVLALYKEVLARAASLFAFLSTATLTDDREFLGWFVGRELSEEREEEALQVYFKNQHSLQFLLVLAIFCCLQLPDHTHQVSRFMRSINLPAEAEGFLFSRDVRDYLEAFYGQTGEGELLEELHARMEAGRQ